MKQIPKYTAEQIEAIATHLKAMPPVEKKKQEFSKQEAVKILIKEITLLQKRGYSLSQIADTLKGQGLDIASPTLKSYLQRAKSPAKSTKKEAVLDTSKTENIITEKADKSANNAPPKADTDDI